MRGLFKKKPKSAAHRLGQRGEELAKKHLKKQGYKILEANYRCKLGELDLVAIDGEYLVFVEVKTRTDLDPLIQMTQAKTKKIRQLALVYLEEKQIRGLQPRFDVIAVTNDGERLRLEHLQNAF